jgi:MlaC protein
VAARQQSREGEIMLRPAGTSGIATVKNFLSSFPQLTRDDRIMLSAIGLPLPIEVTSVDPASQDLVHRPRRQQALLTFSHNDGQWRVIDVYLKSSVSELAMRRDEFANILAKSGFDGLIADLKEKVAKLRPA